MSTNCVPTCSSCGRPILYSIMWLGSLPYHPECNPSNQPYTWNNFVTEDRVREIVKEELKKLSNILFES